VTAGRTLQMHGEPHVAERYVRCHRDAGLMHLISTDGIWMRDYL
jgi:hypothetical protein